MKQSLATAHLPDYRLDEPDAGPDLERIADTMAETMGWMEIGDETLAPDDNLSEVPQLLALLEDGAAKGTLTPKMALGLLRGMRTRIAARLILETMRRNEK